MRASHIPTSILKPDLCVIGAGAGGRAVAAGAAALGVAVVLVEKGEMGGAALQHGHVPLHALIAAGQRANDLRGAVRFGIGGAEPRVDYEHVRAHMAGVITALAPNATQARFEALGVKVVRAAARFIANDTLECGGVLVSARRFVIAAGSAPLAPSIRGMELVGHFDDTRIFDIPVLPERLIVIGGSATGIELAQAFGRLGSDVVVLEAGQALPGEDRELARIVLARLAREGVVVREDVSVDRIEPRGRGVEVVLGAQDGAERLDGSHLITTGRKADIDGLGLGAGGIAYDASGVKVGPGLRSTTNRRVYAIGDAAHGPSSSQLATYHAGLVLRAVLFARRARPDAKPVVRVTYTDPGIAVAGLSEEQARRQHGAIRILRSGFAENELAVIERDTDGHLKVITTAGGTILGVGIVGARAGELIAPWLLAIGAKTKITELGGAAFPALSRSAAAQRAAIAFLAPALRKPWIRRMLRLVRRFG